MIQVWCDMKLLLYQKFITESDSEKNLRLDQHLAE